MTTVTISIKVGTGPVVEATVSQEAVAAMEAFIAEMRGEDDQPKYTGIADLMIRHFRDSLSVPLVKRYSEAVKVAQEQAGAAQKQADDAAAAAAAGTVVVK